MNILVVTQFYYPEPFRVHEICEELARRGNKITVLTEFPNYPEGEIYPEYKDLSKKIEIINNVKVIRCKAKPRKKGTVNLAISYISYALRASLIARKFHEKFDIVYVYQMSPIFMATPAIVVKKSLKFLCTFIA